MITSFSAVPKSPTSEQQIHPEFISVMFTPASFKNPPSMPISPNSFSIRTTCCPFNASLRSFLISVVFPAPRKPEIISIFAIRHASFFIYQSSSVNVKNIQDSVLLTRHLIPHLPILKRPFYKINTIALKFMKFFDFSSHFSYNGLYCSYRISTYLLKGEGFYASYTYQ